EGEEDAGGGHGGRVRAEGGDGQALSCAAEGPKGRQGHQGHTDKPGASSSLLSLESLLSLARAPPKRFHPPGHQEMRPSSVPLRGVLQTDRARRILKKEGCALSSFGPRRPKEA